MKLVDSSIKNPVTVTVGVFFILLFGFIALFRIPVQLTPELQEVEIRVETLWPGASPQEIESEIIDEQEEQLKGVDGLEELRSESLDSRGKVILKFQQGTDEDTALLKVANRLQQVPEYPEQGSPDQVPGPVVRQVSAAAAGDGGRSNASNGSHRLMAVLYS